MKKFIFSIAYLLFVCGGVSQTFEKHLRTEYDDLIEDAFFINESEVVYSYNYGETEQNYETKLYTLNYSSGNLIDSTDVLFSHYDQYNFMGLSHIFLHDNTTLIGLGHAISLSTNDHQLYIVHFNIELQQVFDTLVGSFEHNDNFYNYIINSDGHIISVGRNVSEKSNTCFSEFSHLSISDQILFNTPFNHNRESWTPVFYETDIFGNEISRKLFSHPAHLASTIIEQIELNEYHFVRYWDNEHSFDILNKETLEIDSVVEYPLGFLPRIAVAGNSDTSYYLVGKQGIGSSLYYLSYLEVNQYGNINNQYIFDTDSTIIYTTKTFDINDNYIYFGGEIPFVYDPPYLFYPEPRWILMYKLSLQGDIVWQKFYKGEVHYTPYKVLATPDGGALIFSTRYDWEDPYPLQRDVHILKIDSLGNYIPVGQDEPLIIENQILVYPNPVKNKVHFSFGLYSNLKINIYNLQGQILFSEIFYHSTDIDMSKFPVGVYLYTITNNKGLFEKGKLIKE